MRTRIHDHFIYIHAPALKHALKYAARSTRTQHWTYLDEVVQCISVARGGGGAIAPPPPNNAFSEFCRYIWKFVGTLGNLSVHVSRQACHLYRQTI